MQTIHEGQTGRRAIIRADASVSIGGGHVRRCLVLAETLAQAGWCATFVVRPGTLETMPLVHRSQFACAILERGDDPSQLRESASAGCDLLVVDHYGLDASFESACRGWAKRILVVDDLADRRHDCDILVDQTPGRSAKDYASLVPAACMVLAGPSHALLDRRFHAARQRRRPIADRIRRVLVSFGTTDPGDMTGCALEALRILALGIEVDVVLGSLSPNVERVRSAAAGLSPAAIVRLDVDDMPALMEQADLAIGAGGVSSLERCCLGLPSVIVSVADNQRCNTEAMARAGAALVLGRDVTPDSMAAALRVMIGDPARRRAMSAAARAMCDGRGAERAARAIGNLIAA